MIKSTFLTIGITLLSSALCFCQSSNVPQKDLTKSEIKERLSKQKKAYKEALEQYEEALEEAREQLGDSDARVLRDYLAELPRAPRAPRAPREPRYFNLPHVFEVPDVHVDIPDIEIPDINVVVPDIDFPELNGVIAFDGSDIVVPDVDFPAFYNDVTPHAPFPSVFQFGGSNLLRDLDDGEELRIQALRSVSKQRASKAIPALEKTALEDKSPAVRYSAVKYLARFTDDDRVIPILGKVIKKDDHVDVKKLAIRILGKSGDPRAVKILEEIVSR